MLIVISPSKTQEYLPHKASPAPSKPRHIKETVKIAKTLKSYKPNQLKKLMSISDKLAELNFDRYQNFSPTFTNKNSSPALLTFKGDVYDGFELNKYKKSDFERAQKQLRIISGLYGVLRPLDLIQQYRLEMKTKLKVGNTKDLYHFWGDLLTEAINKDLKALKASNIINLASNEYWSALSGKNLQAEVITPVFQEKKGKTFKTIALFAKRARGMMSDYIIREKVKEVSGLKKFSRDGYRFDSARSEDHRLVFVRG